MLRTGHHHSWACIFVTPATRFPRSWPTCCATSHVEHPARDIRLMAYTTMISALQNEAGDDIMAIGFASR
jgi:hypothetical protein